VSELGGFKNSTSKTVSSGLAYIKRYYHKHRFLYASLFTWFVSDFSFPAEAKFDI